jgi:hypothetical protein
MMNVDWWDNMQTLLDDVEPPFVFLRFADQDKASTLGEVFMQYTNLNNTYQSKFACNNVRYNMTMEVADSRMETVFGDTYVQTASALHPFVSYNMGVSNNLITDL